MRNLKFEAGCSAAREKRRQSRPRDLLRSKKNEQGSSSWYEHSEQARAPHTNGPRDVPRCGALS
jgi:hypothetical protein